MTTPTVTSAAEAASRYKTASADCRRRSATASTASDFDRLLCAQDEMAMCRCQLVKAGRLDLIEAAS
ncbi:hypothetical protein ACWEP4_42955 [Streptomyces sp. NPDC004227]